MSQRLADMSEASLETGGRRAAKAVQEAGFDADLKHSLLERISNANFRSEHASAFAEAELPASAGRQTRDIASAQPWSGTESVEDASLRMLNDAYKPMKVTPRAPAVRGPPSRVDTGRSGSGRSSGARLASARDRTSTYSYMKDLPEDEREAMRKEMKERFTPGAGSVRVSISGLESLANERIEDAIARGKFKNLPRGKVIERDYNASSPFINTTEYLLNRMIQRQEIVPPWIEKQQELVSTATRFRARLRSDWRRHVARTISSRGGTLESQVRLAEEYALAEAVVNPLPKKKVETVNTVDEGGHLSQITLAGELKSTETGSNNSTSEEITVVKESIDASGNVHGSESEVTFEGETSASPTAPASIPSRKPSVAPFRDPTWLQTEQSYHKVAIENLNAIARSYNLMCPQLAQRPYYDLERELKSCYAEVAPQVAHEIISRATGPRLNTTDIGNRASGVFEKFAGTGHKAKVYDEVKPRYGFKELIKEWFGREKQNVN